MASSGGPPSKPGCWSFINQPFVAQFVAGATLTAVTAVLGLSFGIYKQLDDISDHQIEANRRLAILENWQAKTEAKLQRQGEELLILKNQ